ncbi:hypothetical protein MYX06_04235 [Patescibacteria group bacterium AH-259-L05]|nr:hypothetical protein [Patescibacteria group bacterium AH-259-L05]
MNLELIGYIFDVAGKIMVAFTAIMVHHRFWKEHKIDEFVFKTMRKEQIIGIIGIIFILIGFFLQLPTKL